MGEMELVKIAIPLIAASAGGAWAGVKAALHAMQKSVTEVKADVKSARAEVQVVRAEVYDLRLQHGLLHKDFSVLKGQLGEA